MSVVSNAVEAIKTALDDNCGTRDMNRTQYIEVLEEVIEDFKDRLELAKKEQAEEDEG